MNHMGLIAILIQISNIKIFAYREKTYRVYAIYCHHIIILYTLIITETEIGEITHKHISTHYLSCSIGFVYIVTPPRIVCVILTCAIVQLYIARRGTTRTRRRHHVFGGNRHFISETYVQIQQ